MNAPAILTAPEALARYEGRWGAPQKLGFDLNAAHMKAHGWVDIACPLIKAYLAIDQIQGDVICASHEAGVHRHSIRGAADGIGKAQAELLKDIEGIRDAVLSDLSPRQPLGLSHFDHGAWADYDDLCDMWQERIRDVASVDAAIDREARS